MVNTLEQPENGQFSSSSCKSWKFFDLAWYIIAFLEEYCLSHEVHWNLFTASAWVSTCAMRLSRLPKTCLLHLHLKLNELSWHLGCFFMDGSLVNCHLHTRQLWTPQELQGEILHCTCWLEHQSDSPENKLVLHVLWHDVISCLLLPLCCLLEPLKQDEKLLWGTLSCRSTAPPLLTSCCLPIGLLFFQLTCRSSGVFYHINCKSPTLIF